MIDRQKTALRKNIKKMRQQLSASQQEQGSLAVCNQINELDQYDNARHIALYYACNGEIDLSILLQAALKNGKRCYLPALNVNKTLSFLPVAQNTPFIKNCYGIPEPDVDHSLAILACKLDIIFLPLVAFDSHGNRLGMGGGYYDRTLANENHPLLVGVAYDFQHQDHLIAEQWDVPLAAVITEKTTYWRQA